RSVPGVMMNPLHHEFGWSHGVVGLAMSVNMTLFGLTAPFAAAPRIATKLTAATTHAQWMRGTVLGSAVEVTAIPSPIASGCA
ncbi:hypothetical protein BST36_30745, partial [Mycolicibacterium moriokaense]